MRRLYLATKQANEALGRALAREQVSVATWGALDALARTDGASQRELARLVHVEQATMTVQLARMERQGLCRRTPNPQDRRVMRTTITETGRRLLERVDPLAARAQEEFFGRLSAADRDQLGRLLDALLGDAEPGDGTDGSC